MRVYNAGTVTPTTLYATSALDPGSLLTNPVVAGADGWTAQIFAAEGTVVDMQTETAAGVVLHTYEDVVFLGASTGAVTRDFLTNGRVTIRGNGGMGNLEFGDQTGDDTGGTGRIGGWNDTQADSLELDAALVNATGRYKEIGKKLPEIIYTDATQITAASTTDITLPNDPAGVRQYRFDIWDYSQSGVGNMYARLSFDGGATYPSVASSYNGFYETQTGAGVTYATFSNTFAQLHTLRGGTNGPVAGTISVWTPNSGNDQSMIVTNMQGMDGAAYGRFWSLNYGPASLGRATNIRLYMSANTHTYKYRMAIVRATGDA